MSYPVRNGCRSPNIIWPHPGSVCWTNFFFRWRGSNQIEWEFLIVGYASISAIDFQESWSRNRWKTVDTLRCIRILRCCSHPCICDLRCRRSKYHNLYGKERNWFDSILWVLVDDTALYHVSALRSVYSVLCSAEVDGRNFHLVLIC